MVNANITLVLVFNCIGDDVETSIWLFLGAVENAIDGATAIERIEGGKRVIGPVDQEIGMSAYKTLQEVFREIGFAVVTREIADD